MQFAGFFSICPSLQPRNIACSTSQHSKWELMQSPWLALPGQPLPSSVNLLLFLLSALRNTALEIETHTVTPR